MIPLPFIFLGFLANTSLLYGRLLVRGLKCKEDELRDVGHA